jgi:hypothetical protein
MLELELTQRQTMQFFVTCIAGSDAAWPKSKQLVARMRTIFRAIPLPVTELPEVLADGFAIDVGRSRVSVRYVHEPVPAAVLAMAGRARQAWSEAPRVLAAARTHALVAVEAESLSTAEAVHAAYAVTMTVGAIADFGGVTGAVWTASGAAAPGDMLPSLAIRLAEREIPLPFWIALETFFDLPSSDGRPMLGVQTNGLTAFAGCEIELYPASVSRWEANRLVLGFCRRLLIGGEKFDDGALVSTGPGESLRVRYLSRGRKPSRRVIELAYQKTEAQTSPAGRLRADATPPRRNNFGRRGA